MPFAEDFAALYDFVIEQAILSNGDDLADVESGSQSLQERPQFGRFESDIQRRHNSPYSKACMISNDELR